MDGPIGVLTAIGRCRPDAIREGRQLVDVEAVHAGRVRTGNAACVLDGHVAAMQVAKGLGRPVWCDWDDDILGVPSNNGRVFVYQDDKHKGNVKALCAGADVITATCEELASRFRPYAGKPSKVITIPNAIDPCLTLAPPNPDKLPVRRIAWRGGDSHNEDLLVLGGAFPRVAQEYEGRVLWPFIGFNPHWLLRDFPAETVTVNQWIGNVVAYLRFMGEMRPSFLAVPLADTKFNRAKSNISVLEAAWMGALPIAPRWLEGCALPGVLLYNDQNDFPDALRRACEMPEQERLERLADLRAAINASPYELRNANMQRALILKRLSALMPNITPPTAGRKETDADESANASEVE
jgi:hypothetical protein